MAPPPKQKGEACNRCKTRRVRCTGENGEPCAACLRSAKFKGHDLALVTCAYHGAGRCSEEGDATAQRGSTRRRRKAREESVDSDDSMYGDDLPPPPPKKRSATARRTRGTSEITSVVASLPPIEQSTPSTSTTPLAAALPSPMSLASTSAIGAQVVDSSPKAAAPSPLPNHVGLKRNPLSLHLDLPTPPPTTTGSTPIASSSTCTSALPQPEQQQQQDPFHWSPSFSTSASPSFPSSSHSTSSRASSSSASSSSSLYSLDLDLPNFPSLGGSLFGEDYFGAASMMSSSGEPYIASADHTIGQGQGVSTPYWYGYSGSGTGMGGVGEAVGWEGDSRALWEGKVGAGAVGVSAFDGLELGEGWRRS